jgi:hypothetical protein
MRVTGIDHLVKVTLVEDHNKSLMNHAKVSRQLHSLNKKYKPVNRICCLVMYKLGAHLVSFGTGLQRRFGDLLEVAV